MRGEGRRRGGRSRRERGLDLLLLVEPPTGLGLIIALHSVDVHPGVGLVEVAEHGGKGDAAEERGDRERDIRPLQQITTDTS